MTNRHAADKITTNRHDAREPTRVKVGPGDHREKALPAWLRRRERISASDAPQELDVHVPTAATRPALVPPWQSCGGHPVVGLGPQLPAVRCSSEVGLGSESAGPGVTNRTGARPSRGEAKHLPIEGDSAWTASTAAELGSAPNRLYSFYASRRRREPRSQGDRTVRSSSIAPLPVAERPGLVADVQGRRAPLPAT